MISNNLNHLIPFHHEDIDKWRNSLSGGISYIDEETMKLHFNKHYKGYIKKLNLAANLFINKIIYKTNY